MAEANDLYPFIGFHFKGQSSKDVYNIYRVSEGDRYTIDLDSDSQDITVEVPGRDGAYYFGTTYKPKVFNIKIAFDSLTKKQLKDLKTWLSKKVDTTQSTVKALYEFYLDEESDEKYMVRVTGTPQLKCIPFDDAKNETVYKGEGTIQFTAYYPFPISQSSGSQTDSNNQGE